MKIIVDVMSGDNAPGEIIAGAFAAKNDFHVNMVLVGDPAVINDYCEKNELDLSDGQVEIVESDGVISMEDSPLSVVREKSTSSMGTALRLLAEGKGDALVSAGNTGALHAGSTLLVRRIKGLSRSAIATILPFEKPLLLLDSGANLEVTKEQLEQFALMGSIYMENIFGITQPKVGLANIGTEPTKGTKMLIETYQFLSQSDKINFVGNIEGKQIPYSECDVLVCDGFTGNMILKLTEGLAGFLFKNVKEMFMKNTITKLSAATMKPHLLQLKKSFDSSEYGGAPMLGISKPVIKAHGSADALTIRNSVRQAIDFVNTAVIVDIMRAITPSPKEDEES